MADEGSWQPGACLLRMAEGVDSEGVATKYHGLVELPLAVSHISSPQNAINIGQMNIKELDVLLYVP